MVRSVLVVLLFALTVGCSSENKVESEAEETYDLTGTVTGVAADGTRVTIRHEAVEGYMDAMTMEFAVRGQKGDLPPAGTAVDATLHVSPGGAWLTGVREKRGRPDEPGAQIEAGTADPSTIEESN